MRVISAAVALVALVVVTLGWLGSSDRLTAAEAATVAQHAYEAAGVDAARVDPAPEAGVYVTAAGDAAVPVWKTVATVEGGTIQLWLSRVDGESVFLDDRSADGTRQLLTDEQFSGLADHYENPAVSRQIRRNLLLTLASGLVVLLAVRFSALGAPVDRRRLVGAGGERPRRAPRVDVVGTGIAPITPARLGWDAEAAPDAGEDEDAPQDEDAPPDGGWDDDDAGDDELDVEAPEDELEEEAEDELEEGLDAAAPGEPSSDEWEPMWAEPDDADATPDGEWEPMWDDRPGASGAEADAWETTPAAAGPAPTPERRGARSRLRAPQRRQLHAPDAP